MKPFDIYALESWLRDKALEAHTQNCEVCKIKELCFETTGGEGGLCVGMELAFNETIAKIQNMRKNQRPHVPVNITEEFDGSR